MTLLPIVERELRVAARQPTTYWLRTLAALGAMILGAVALRGATNTAGSAVVGGRLFQLLADFGLSVSLLSGVLLTSDSLSREKREGTLGLLFLTKLRSHEVILGKLAASSLHAGCGLLAAAPVLGLPLLMGGVTPGEYARVGLVLANTLWFSLAAGLFFSAISWQARSAALATGAMLIVINIPILFGGSVWTVLSPLTGLLLLPQGTFQSSPGMFFWRNIVAIQAGGWVWLFLANWCVHRSWRNPGRAALRSDTAGRAVQWDHPALSKEENIQLTQVYGGVHRSERPAMLERNPIEWWAAGRSRTLVWVGLVVVFGLALLGRSLASGDYEAAMIGVVALLALHGWIEIWVAWEASRRFVEERRLGLLELLVVTPLPVSAFLRGQMKSLWRQFDAPVLVVLGFDILVLVFGLEHFKVSRTHWVITMLTQMALFPVLCFGLAWAGLWQGLKTGKTRPSALLALLKILTIPTAVSVPVLISQTRLGRMYPPWGMMWTIWIGSSLVFTLYFGAEGWWALRRHFRRLAAGESTSVG